MINSIAFMGDTGTFCDDYIESVKNLTCDNVVLLGDNFYPRGVTQEHLTNHCRLWKNKHINKYMILGNHEYSGLPVKMYLKSPYWIMPSYCYMVEYDECDVIMIDTMQLEPNWGLPEEHITTYLGSPGLVSRGLVSKSTGFKSFSDVYNFQLSSIMNCLKHNPKKPKIVCGHYHLESPGYYSANNKLKNILMPLFKIYNVKAYICGHEHLSEHRTIFYDDEYHLEHFISGGLESRPHIKPSNRTKFYSIESSYLEAHLYKKKIMFKFVTPKKETRYNFNLHL